MKSSQKKTRIAVFVSGGGTNLEHLLLAQEAGQIPHGEIVLVCASNESAYALTRAANHGVPGVAVPKKQLTQEAFEAALTEKLTEYRVDMIVLAGFLSILSENGSRARDTCTPLTWTPSSLKRPVPGWKPPATAPTF